MMNKFYAWLVSTDGVTGIEYGLITAGISCVAGVSAMVLGDEMSRMFDALMAVDLDRGSQLSQ
jgi:Flp pilus assembly pilin Flp